MANELKTYSIKLDIDQSDKVNASIASIKNNLDAITKSTKAFNFDDASKSLDAMKRELIESAKAGTDISKALDSYDKSVKKISDDLSKQAVILNHSLSEQGKAERERLKALDALQTRTKEEEAERRRLSKTVIRGTDNEIKALLEKNKALRVSAKLSTLELREQTKQRKTLKDLIKSDLSGLGALIKKQKEFIASLKTTEGRYNALKKAGKVALKVGGGMAAGAAGLLGGMAAGAMSAASGRADKDAEARRMKGFSGADREAIMNELYIQSGRSPSEIVDAVNRVTSTLKTRDRDKVIRAAKAELDYPGMSSMLQGATVTGSLSFDILASRLRKVQSITGASGADIEAAMKAASKSRLANGKFSQSEYVALYSALKGTGAFEDEATMERFLVSFMRQADSEQPLGEQLQAFTEKNINRFLYKQQDRNRATRAIESIDAVALSKALSEISLSTSKTDAERTAENARRLQAKKDKLMEALIPALTPVVEKLAELAKSGAVQKIMNGAIDFFTWGMDVILSVMEKLNEWLSDGEEAPQSTDNSQNLEEAVKTQTAQGGITHGLTLAGERGQEMIIPLDYARRGRAVNIVNNWNQTFTSPASTVGAMAASVKGSPWVNAFIQGR